jgi:hypothetical protein
MSASSRAATDTPGLDLTALRSMTFEELDALYRTATRPTTISALDGNGKGAMLAWRAPRSGPVAAILRSFGRSSTFPWKGKSFQSLDERQGEGINRISLLGTRQWFPFGTHFGKSFLDGKPTFVLDYSRRPNPPLIKQIVDEVREVAPGLYMGPAALNIGGRPRHILFFAISFQ